MISEGNDADVDLCLMTKCDYHIIANSSFSWWGAWLGDSEKIVKIGLLIVVQVNL